MLSPSQTRLRHALIGVTILVFLYWLTSGASRSNDIPQTSDRAGDGRTILSHLKLPKHQYAFAAFLAEPEKPGKTDDDDVYFVATRILAYSLLHDPDTRTNTSIPFLVLVTDEVTQSKRDRLVADGATLIPVGKISFEWIQASRERWRDVLSKLYMFTLTQYERILFMDSDMLILHQMDSIFQDAAATLQTTLTNPENAPPDEGVQPPTYAFGGVAGQGGYQHPFPPRKGNACNAGFIMFRPAMDLFNHYMLIAETGVGKFNPNYPEQNLWNYVHRKKGNMPWQQIETIWNANWATAVDARRGVRTLHTKWWSPGPEKDMKDLAMRIKWKMEGNAQGRDAARAHSR